MAATLPGLLKAIQAGSAPDVKRVLSYNPSLAHARSAGGRTPLHFAADTTHLSIVKELLQTGASCHEADANLEVPLHIACRQRNGAPVVKELLSDAGRRSCMKSMNRDGATPLHVAVQAGLLEVVQLLVNAGAKVDAVDRAGRTPLDYVDPRLPGLAEVLEAGRQLTPVRSAAAAGGGGGGGNGNNNKGTPTASKHTKAPPLFHSPARAAGAGGPPSPGKKGVCTTPQRRRSANGQGGVLTPTNANTNTNGSNSQAMQAADGPHRTPVQHRRGLPTKQACRTPQGQQRSGGGLLSRQFSAGSIAEVGGHTAAATEGSAASMAASPSKGPPRHTSSPPAAAAAEPASVTAEAAATEQQCSSQMVVAQDSSLLPDERKGAVGAAAEAAACTGSDAGADAAVAQSASAAAAGGPVEMAEAEADMQSGKPESVAAGSSIIDLQQHHQQQQQRAAAEMTSSSSNMGPLHHSKFASQHQQQQLNAARILGATAAPGAPGAAPAALTGGGPTAGPFCRGPLSLAHPQMQQAPMQQQQQQQQQQSMVMMQSNNTSQLSVLRGSSSAITAPPGMGPGSSIPMGPLRSGRVAAAQAAAASGSASDHPSSAAFRRSSDPLLVVGHAVGSAAPGPLTACRSSTFHPGGSSGGGGGGSDMFGVLPRRQSSSSNGMVGGNSWIVTPEASSGLLGGGGGGGGAGSGASHGGLATVAAAAGTNSSSNGGGGSGISNANLNAGASIGGGTNSSSRAAAEGPSNAHCAPLTAPAAAEQAGSAQQQQQAHDNDDDHDGAMVEAVAAEGTAQEEKEAAVNTDRQQEQQQQVAADEHSEQAQQAPAASTRAAAAPQPAPPSAHQGGGGGSVAAAAAAADHHHPMLAAAQQLHRQQQQLAGIAAAVAAASGNGSSSSSGPLQAPLLAQLAELSGKVARLEAWFEAQVELIPDWQKALEVVQAVKRQADDHGHLLTEQEATLAHQASFLTDLATKVEGLNTGCTAAQEGLCENGQKLTELQAGQEGLKSHLTAFEQQLQQLQDQLAAAEGAQASSASREAQISSLVSQLDDTNSQLDATAARLSSLETTTTEAQQQLLEQHQAVAAATALAVAATERSAAAEAAAASAAAAAATANDGSTSARSRGSATAAAAAGFRPAGSTCTAQQALLTESLTKQVADLKMQLGELSATVTSMSRASRVAAAFGRRPSRDLHSVKSEDFSGPSPAAAAVVGAAGDGGGGPAGGTLVLSRPHMVQSMATAGLSVADCGTAAGGGGDGDGDAEGQEGLVEGVEENWLPFMESTSACLAAHEHQIGALQALVPKLEGVVSQRAQLINMAEQLAALQTAFNMLPHGGHSSRPGSHGGAAAAASPLHALVPAGPLGSHKAASDALNLATSMVKLQGQMGQMTLAVEALREEWEEASTAVRGEREAIRRDWEAERARIAAAEAEVARLLSEQQAEFAEREERLIQIRAAASEAEDAARMAALESQQLLAGQLTGLQAQQALMAQQLAAAHASNNALKAELAQVQEKLTATEEAQAAMAEAQATAAATAAITAALPHAPVIHDTFEHVEHACPAATAPGDAAARGCVVDSNGSHPYPHVREQASPCDNPFLVDPALSAPAGGAAAPAEVPVPASMPVSPDDQTASLLGSGEPSAELAVLGQQRLVSSSVFGPSYWAGAGEAKRHSSSSNGGRGSCSPPPATDTPAAESSSRWQSGAGASHDERSRVLTASTATATTTTAAAAAMEQLQTQQQQEAAAAADGQVGAGGAAWRGMRVTYDAAMPTSRNDKDYRDAAGADGRSYFAAGSIREWSRADEAGAGTASQTAVIAGTYPLFAGPPAAATSTLSGGGRKKKSWLAKVGLGPSSKAQAAGPAAAVLAVDEQQQRDRAGFGQPTKRSAGGALFGRWSKHSTSKAAAAAAAMPTHSLEQGYQCYAASSSDDRRSSGTRGGVAVYDTMSPLTASAPTGLRASLQQHHQHQQQQVQGCAQDVRTGADISDQVLMSLAPSASSSKRFNAGAAAAAAAAVGMHHSAGGKWTRRLLGKSSKA